MGRNPSPRRDRDPELDDGAAVYDRRGNTRPRGTPGAARMTFGERVEIAKALAAGEDPPPLPRAPEVPAPVAPAAPEDSDA